MHKCKSNQQEIRRWASPSTIGGGLLCNIGHLLIHYYLTLQLSLQLSNSSTNVKVSNLASKEGSSHLLVLLFIYLFIFFACMDFPRSRFPFRQPTGRWKEDEEVGKIIDIFPFAHRSIFVTDRSLERKEVGHARTCFFFPGCRFAPGSPAFLT